MLRASLYAGMMIDSSIGGCVEGGTALLRNSLLQVTDQHRQNCTQ